MILERTFTQQLRFMQGRLRIVKEPDGFFVIGEGLRLPVRSYDEGLNFIKECEEELALKYGGDKGDE
jgi:hypothetical protein